MTEREKWTTIRREVLERTVDCDAPLCSEETKLGHPMSPDAEAMGDQEGTSG